MTYSPADTEPWMQDARCTEASGDFWYPDTGHGSEGTTKMAKAICRKCPVAAPCLEYALANDEQYGIWGGTTPAERREKGAAA